MSPSLRFLAMAVIGWAGLRAATLGMVPGTEIIADPSSDPKPAAIQATQFADIDPIAPAPTAPLPFQPASLPYYEGGAMQPLVVPVYYSYRGSPAPQQASGQGYWEIPDGRPVFHPVAAATLDEWPLSRLASAAAMPARSTVTTPMQTTAPAIAAARIDRIQLTMWAMLRNRQSLLAAPTALFAQSAAETTPPPDAMTPSESMATPETQTPVVEERKVDQFAAAFVAVQDIQAQATQPRVVARTNQPARDRLETAMLPRWAAAIERRDAKAAAAILDEAGALAQQLAADGGDTMPRDGIARVRDRQRAGSADEGL